MPDFEIGDAQLGVVIGIHVFDEFIRELFVTGVVASQFRFGLDNNDDGVPELLVTLDLNLPTFTLESDGTGERFTQLHLTGTLVVHAIADPNADPLEPVGDPIVDTPLDVRVRLLLALVPRPADPPVLRLVYDGVAQTPSPPITAQQVDTLFTSPAVAVLDDVEIDVAGPLIDGLESIHFPDGDAPARDAWPTALTLMPGDGAGEVDAVAVTVAVPGDDPDPGEAPSFLPIRTGFGLVYSRGLMDDLLARGASERIGDEVCGARILSLEVRTDAGELSVFGILQPQEFPLLVIPFGGTARPHLIRGTTALVLDTSDVVAAIPPGLGRLGRFLALFVAFGFPPFIFAVPSIWDATQKIDGAPEGIRNGLAAALGTGLQRLSEGLALDTSLDDVSVLSTPDRLQIREGAFLFLAQVFVSPIEDQIFHALYSPELRRFELFRLTSGRKFNASELARLVGAGKIALADHHDVNGRYLRADPDRTRQNNLLQRFSDLRPDEPILVDAVGEAEGTEGC